MALGNLMHKLTIRFPAFLAVIGSLGAIYLCLRQLPTMMVELPSYVVFAAAVLSAGLFAVIAYRKASTAQKIEVAMAGLALSLFYGLFANLTFFTTRMLPDYHLLVHVAVLFFMTIGGALTAFLLFKLDTKDTASPLRHTPQPETPGKPVEADLSKPKASSSRLASQPAEPAKVSPSNTGTNLKGILDTLSPEESSTKLPQQTMPKPAAAAASAQSPAAAQPSAGQTGANSISASANASPVASTAPASTGASLPTSPTESQSNLPEQKKAGASSTATRLQAQKRKSTSTFTKLQALSASGTGTRQKPSEPSSGEGESDSLKSILDRLDTKSYDEQQEEVYPVPEAEEVAMDSLFSQESLLSPPEVPPETPATKPSQTAASTSTPAKSADKPSPAPVKAKASDQPPSLSSMLDSFDTPKNKSASTSPVAKASGNSSTTSGATTKPATPNNAPAAKPAASGAQTGSNKPATQPAASQVKPAQPVAQPAKPTTSVQPTKPTTSPSQPAKPATPAASVKPAPNTTPVAKAAQPAKPVEQAKPAEKVKAEEKKPEPAKAEGLFETGIDKEIDDIFSNLVPAEAQKEVQSTSGEIEAVGAVAEEQPSAEAKVQDELAAEIEPSTTPEEAPAAKDGLFETGIDREIDDIFSDLVPAEALKEVTKESAPAKEPEKAEAVIESETTEEASADSGLFAESGLDKELDDIFSNLAPSEAQLSVTHETLAKVRAADATGDHPAIAPESLARPKKNCRSHHLQKRRHSHGKRKSSATWKTSSLVSSMKRWQACLVFNQLSRDCSTIWLHPKAL